MNKFFIFLLFVLPVITNASVINNYKFGGLPEVFNPVNQDVSLRAEFSYDESITILDGFRAAPEIIDFKATLNFGSGDFILTEDDLLVNLIVWDVNGTLQTVHLMNKQNVRSTYVRIYFDRFQRRLRYHVRAAYPQGRTSRYEGTVDYNQIVSNNPVPEASSLTLIGLGLLGLIGFKKKVVE